VITVRKGGFRVLGLPSRSFRRIEQTAGVSAEIRDVADGLWIWRVGHPDWRPGLDWEPAVTSTCVESEGEIVVLDALVPPTGFDAVLERLDARPPTAAVVLKPDHVRDVDVFVRRYGGIRAFGPRLFFRYDIPETELWLPEQRTVVFADALTAPDGVLRVWATPWHETRALPALRALLDLPFERVIVSHGEPVHTRADYECALNREPWTGQ
jgi:glyoxylase-like metal-dependent hydrolase (beta-lactamase superfamily II)